MDVGTAWSIVRLGGNAGKVALGANPVVLAITATLLVKKWVDSEKSKVFELVRQRENCIHIIMLEGSPPTSCALEYVAKEGGIAWFKGSSSLYFWHEEPTFRPLVFDEALVPGPNGVRRVTPRDYADKVTRPKDGYGCSRCQEANQQKRG